MVRHTSEALVSTFPMRKLLMKLLVAQFCPLFYAMVEYPFLSPPPPLSLHTAFQDSNWSLEMHRTCSPQKNILIPLIRTRGLEKISHKNCANYSNIQNFWELLICESKHLLQVSYHVVAWWKYICRYKIIDAENAERGIWQSALTIFWIPRLDECVASSFSFFLHTAAKVGPNITSLHGQIWLEGSVSIGHCPLEVGWTQRGQRFPDWSDQGLRTSDASAGEIIHHICSVHWLCRVKSKGKFVSSIDGERNINLTCLVRFIFSS